MTSLLGVNVSNVKAHCGRGSNDRTSPRPSLKPGFAFEGERVISTTRSAASSSRSTCGSSPQSKTVFPVPGGQGPGMTAKREVHRQIFWRATRRSTMRSWARTRMPRTIAGCVKPTFENGVPINWTTSASRPAAARTILPAFICVAADAAVSKVRVAFAAARAWCAHGSQQRRWIGAMLCARSSSGSIRPHSARRSSPPTTAGARSRDYPSPCSSMRPHIVADQDEHVWAAVAESKGSPERNPSRGVRRPSDRHQRPVGAHPLIPSVLWQQDLFDARSLEARLHARP